MAEKNDSGDRTEKPTPKRLADARKKGDVAKSKDMSSTATLGAWLLVGLCLGMFGLQRLAALFDTVLAVTDRPFDEAFRIAGLAAFQALLLLSVVTFLPVAILGSVAEFLQVGPVFTLEKMSPKFSHMNPGEGLKRMVNLDNLVEAAKSLAKTLLLVAICWVVIATDFSQLARLPASEPRDVLRALSSTTFKLVAAGVAAFLLVSALDLVYQKHSFIKKLRMSRRDIKQEMKDAEGDPHVRAQRRQMHQEWAQQNAVQAARDASVLVVNPTHIACALAYDPAQHAAPVLLGKGEGPVAAAMREAAEAEGVPIIRNVELARALRDKAVIDDIVPQDLFAAVAEVILWARRIRETAAEEPASDDAATPSGPSFPAPPEIAVRPSAPSPEEPR